MKTHIDQHELAVLDGLACAADLLREGETSLLRVPNALSNTHALTARERIHGAILALATAIATVLGLEELDAATRVAVEQYVFGGSREAIETFLDRLGITTGGPS